MEIDGRKIVLWDCNKDAEELYFKSKDEAVEAWLYEMGGTRDGELTVYGYARMIVPPPTEEDADRLVEEWFETH